MTLLYAGGLAGLVLVAGLRLATQVEECENVAHLIDALMDPQPGEPRSRCVMHFSLIFIDQDQLFMPR